MNNLEHDLGEANTFPDLDNASRLRVDPHWFGFRACRAVLFSFFLSVKTITRIMLMLFNVIITLIFVIVVITITIAVMTITLSSMFSLCVCSIVLWFVLVSRGGDGVCMLPLGKVFNPIKSFPGESLAEESPSCN